MPTWLHVQKISGSAQAQVVQTLGDAEAAKALAIGSAEADVIKMKIASMTSENYASVEIARALAGHTHRLVPDIVASGGSDGGGLVQVLLAKMLKENQ